MELFHSQQNGTNIVTRSTQYIHWYETRDAFDYGFSVGMLSQLMNYNPSSVRYHSWKYVSRYKSKHTPGIINIMNIGRETHLSSFHSSSTCCRCLCFFGIEDWLPSPSLVLAPFIRFRSRNSGPPAELASFPLSADLPFAIFSGACRSLVILVLICCP